MTLRISSAAKNMADLPSISLSRAAHTFWYEGDNTLVDFSLPDGWRPLMVFVNGALMRDGDSEDYTVAYDGFLHTITFSVAPAGVNVGIKAERVI